MCVEAGTRNPVFLVPYCQDTLIVEECGDTVPENAVCVSRGIQFSIFSALLGNNTLRSSMKAAIHVVGQWYIEQFSAWNDHLFAAPASEAPDPSQGQRRGAMLTMILCPAPITSLKRRSEKARKFTRDANLSNDGSGRYLDSGLWKIAWKKL
jgi:hypothetical protein